MKQTSDTQKKKIPIRGRRPLGATPGREALLQVALVEFSKCGYEATSLRNLAQAAQVDVALVARLFGSKANLWEAVVEQLATVQLKHLAALKEAELLIGSNPTKAMVELIKVFVHVSYEMPALANFLMHEMSNPGVRMNMLLKRLVLPFRHACWPILCTAIESGVIRATRPEVLFSMLISAISMPLAAPSLIDPSSGLTPELRDEIEKEVTQMIIVRT